MLRNRIVSIKFGDVNPLKVARENENNDTQEMRLVTSRCQPRHNFQKRRCFLFFSHLLRLFTSFTVFSFSSSIIYESPAILETADCFTFRSPKGIILLSRVTLFIFEALGASSIQSSHTLCDNDLIIHASSTIPKCVRSCFRFLYKLAPIQ